MVYSTNLSNLANRSDEFDLDTYVRANLGDRTINHSAIYTTIFGVLFLLGVIGNGVTVSVLILGNWKRGWSGIDAYLMNLALTDLLQTTISLPLEIYKYWNQYPWCLGQFFCSLSALLAEATLYSSILTIKYYRGGRTKCGQDFFRAVLAAFTLERYCAIVNPLWALRFHSSSRAWKVICLCWLIAVVNAVPFSFYHRVNYLTSPDGSAILSASWCAIHYNLNTQLAPLFVYSAVLFYLLPMLVLGGLYMHIWLVLQERARNHSYQPDNEPPSGITPDGELCDASVKGYRDSWRKPRSSIASCRRASRFTVRTLSRQSDTGTQTFQPSKRVYHVLLAIILNFFVCYGLFHAQRLVFSWVDWSNRDEAIRWTFVNNILFPISGFLYHANPALDAVLYSLMSRKFILSYRRIFCWCREERRESRRSLARAPLARGSQKGAQ